MNSYEEAIKFIFQQIPSSKDIKFPGELGLKRMELLLDVLGRPEKSYKAIHIAATSGKGSTTAFATNLLLAHGYRVGSTVSPHLIDIRERAQINGKPCTKAEFLAGAREVQKAHQNVAQTELGAPTYSEVMIAIALVVFRNAEVDFAVIETCLGGLYDTTNAISCEKVMVLGRIGLDHTHILGNTLGEIASQKAGIIRRKGEVVALRQDSVVDKVFAQQAAKHDAPISWIDSAAVSNIHHDAGIFTYDLHLGELSLKSLKLASPGRYQVDNSALALAAVYKLLGKVDRTSVKISLESTVIKGRFEEQTIGTARLVIDAAHNPQKMKALITALQERYGQRGEFFFFLSFKESKDYEAMLDEVLINGSDAIYTDFSNEFQDAKIRSVPFASFPREYADQIEYITGVECALREAIASSSKKNKILVITGSMYLLADVYSVIDKLKILEQNEPNASKGE